MPWSNCPRVIYQFLIAAICALATPTHAQRVVSGDPAGAILLHTPWVWNPKVTAYNGHIYSRIYLPCDRQNAMKGLTPQLVEAFLKMTQRQPIPFDAKVVMAKHHSHRSPDHTHIVHGLKHSGLENLDKNSTGKPLKVSYQNHVHGISIPPRKIAIVASDDEGVFPEYEPLHYEINAYYTDVNLRSKPATDSRMKTSHL